MLTGRAFAQPAGWAFLGLGTALAWSGFVDVYAELALTWRPDAPAGPLAATLGDTSFVWWFVFLALVLQFTPPGPVVVAAARWLPRSTVGGRRGLPGHGAAAARRLSTGRTTTS